MEGKNCNSLLLIYKTRFQLEISSDPRDEKYNKAKVEIANDKEEEFNAKMIIWKTFIWEWVKVAIKTLISPLSKDL